IAVHDAAQTSAPAGVITCRARGSGVRDAAGRDLRGASRPLVRPLFRTASKGRSGATLRSLAIAIPDSNPTETREWLGAADAVAEYDGRDRMGFLLDQTIDHAQDSGVKVSAGLSTPYVNTIPVEEEPELPGDPELEQLATALVRWNAIAIVLQANAESSELGG